jgi:ubiquinone/menaquinone biosynthesis C-methylase UbiE
MNDEEQKKLRRAHAIHYDAVADEYVSVFFDDRIDEPWLLRFSDRLRPRARILDAGCGPGSFSKLLIQNGYHVVGLDISMNMINRAKQLVPEGDFVVGDLADLSLFPADAFDGILCAYSLLHLTDEVAIKALGEFRRVLNRDGVLALMLKLGESSGWVPATLRSADELYLRLWTEDGIKAVLHECGFVITDVSRSWPTSKHEYPYEKLLVIAKTIN